MQASAETRDWVSSTAKISLFGGLVGLGIPFFFFPERTVANFVIGFSIGVVLTWLIFTVERFLVPPLRAYPFVVEIAVVAAVRLFAGALAGSLVLSIYLGVSGILPLSQAFPEAVYRAVLRPDVVPIYAFFLVASVLATSILSVSRKLGPGVLLSWVVGRYRQPREEQRVVMFLDINDSTAIAEQLGDAAFSAFVRDFMADLTGSILASKAQVSHYIGDEVVLTWPISAKRPRAAWPEFLALVDLRLADRAPYYQAEYGFAPRCKAGVHMGTVITTEVGVLKSEIVHHGDALNVGARLAGLSKTHGAYALASSRALECADGLDRFAVEPVGEIEVRGRKEAVEAFRCTLPAG